MLLMFIGGINNLSMNNKETREVKSIQIKFRNDAIKFALQVLFVFSGSGILAIIVGRFIDSQFPIGNIGTLISLFVFYVIGWAVVFYLGKKSMLNKSLSTSSVNDKEKKNDLNFENKKDNS